MDIHYTVVFPGRELSCQTENVEHFINACSCRKCTFARGHKCPVSFVLVCFPFKVMTIGTAWFGLSAPLFTLDQCVHLTAPRGQGEGEREEGAVLFRLTAKGIRLWQILSFMFVFLYLS